jgi:hypothetical protein
LPEASCLCVCCVLASVVELVVVGGLERNDGKRYIVAACVGGRRYVLVECKLLASWRGVWVMHGARFWLWTRRSRRRPAFAALVAKYSVA